MNKLPGLKLPTQDQTTILIVDDQPLVQDALHAVLSRAGYHVLVAGGGAAALAAWEAHGRPIGLLLTDVFMPDMNGPELAAALSQRQPGLKVIFMSGAPREDLDHLFAQLDQVQFLAKPVDLNLLRETVKATFIRLHMGLLSLAAFHEWFSLILSDCVT